MSAPVVGTITSLAGSVVAQGFDAANLASIVLTPPAVGTPYAGVSVVVEGSEDGGATVPYPLAVVRKDTGVTVPGGTPIALADGSCLKLTADISGGTNYVRVRPVAFGSGTLQVRIGTGTPFSGAPASGSGAPGAVSVTVDLATEAALGGPADARASADSGDAPGSLVAQLRALNAQFMIGMREIFRDWKNAELRELRAIRRVLAGQAGAWSPIGGDETDGQGDDLSGGTS